MKQVSFLLLIALGLTGFTCFRLPLSYPAASTQIITQPISIVGKPTCTAEYIATLVARFATSIAPLATPSVMPNGSEEQEAPCVLPAPTVDPNAIPHGSPIAIVPFFIAPQTPVPKVADTN